MKILEWLLTTIQYRSLKAYKMIKLEEKRREKESETPFEKTWFFRLQRLIWQVKHKRRCGYSAIEVATSYLDVIEVLSQKSETFQTDSFSCIGVELRLSGGTLVINEVWAINQYEGGIYVHKREGKDADWKAVYRTNWLMDDVDFIPLLLNAKRLACVAVPALGFRKDDASELAGEAIVH